MRSTQIFSWVLLVAVGLAALPLLADERADSEQVDAWIKQLGAPSFATRQRAQAALEQLGLNAFDALHAAQYHEDTEIARRSRYLVRRLQVSWAQPDDTREVQEILKQYGQGTRHERQSLMQRLSGLGDDEGVPALCRLVRYESSYTLSKQAALLIMSRRPETEMRRGRLADRIQLAVGTSNRQAADWLRAFAATLRDSRSALPTWGRLTTAEQREFAERPERTSREITRDLIRWYAQELIRHDETAAARLAMRETIDLLDGTREQLLDAMNWFMEQSAWPLVCESADRYRDVFDRSPLLLYRLAESHHQLQQSRQAEAAAARALAASPEDTREHIVLALALQHGGLVTWAEREYRFVLGQVAAQTSDAVRAGLLLAEMLNDEADSQRAADVLGELLASAEQHPQILEISARQFGRSRAALDARRWFFIADQAARQRRTSDQLTALRKGLQADPFDVDILIAFYRQAQLDQANLRDAREHLQAAVRSFEEKLAALQQTFEQAMTARERAEARWDMAPAYNQLAWLISNTEGDFERAIQYSRESLKLRPDTAGYLDTLGRCYYAKGDYANAVRFQTMAVELEPNSKHNRRQLELFESALESAARTSAAKPPAPVR